MAVTCGICHENESKYRCPKCEIRFCSVPCNKIHKAEHEVEVTNATSAIYCNQATPSQDAVEQQAKSIAGERVKLDAPEKPKFDGFQDDAEFKRLLNRYPCLPYQLQLIYGITMEPGPDDAYTWGKQKWFDDGSSSQRSKGFRGRGGRGRGRGGFRGDWQGNLQDDLPVEERQHGPWTQTKADNLGLGLVRKLREANHVELAEGMREFTRLCALRFGE